MKLYLFWERSTNGLSPSCTSNMVNSDGVSPLTCLLTDDGGQKFFDTLPWLNEGLNRIKSIKEAKLNFVDWSRNAWGAELTRANAKIYSLHDEEYFEILDLDSFEIALLTWRNFIQSQPKIGLNQTLEI